MYIVHTMDFLAIQIFQVHTILTKDVGPGKFGKNN